MYRVNLQSLELALHESLSENERRRVVQYIFEVCESCNFEGNTACAKLVSKPPCHSPARDVHARACPEQGPR